MKSTMTCLCFILLCLTQLSFGQTYKIGALMTVADEERLVNPAYTGAFESNGIHAINGWRMWEQMVNAKGGIVVNGVAHQVEITVINVGASVAKVAQVTNETCLGMHGDFDLIFGPWSSGYTEVAAQVTESYNRLMIAGFAASTSVFACLDDWENQPGCEGPSTRRFEYTWGTLKAAEFFLEDVMNILKLKGSRTFFTWVADTVYTKSLVGGAEAEAEKNGIELIERVVVGAVPTDEEISAVVDRIEELNPDIIMASPRFPEGCIQFIQEIKKRKVTANAIIVSQCTTTQIAQETLGDDIRYLIESTTWSPLVRGSEYTDKLHFPPTEDKQSAQIFSEQYEALYGEAPDSIAAIAFAQGEVIEFVLSRSQSTNQDDIIPNLRLLLETSMAGNLGFDGFGMNDKMSIPSSQRDVNGTVGLLSPLGSSTLDMVYPFPGWDERVQIIGYLGFVEEKVIFVITLIAIIVSIVLGIIIMVQKGTNNSVSAASPYFLLLILFGSLLMYASVLTWMMWMNTFMCISKSWFLGVGFVLIFGTLVAKTHRIKKVFIFNSFKVKAITDTQLFGLVCILVGIEILINLVWTIVSPSEAYNVIVDENRPVYNYLGCSWNPIDSIFLVIGVVYKALIVLYSLYLSTKLWRHSRSVFVESKQIIFSIYNLTIFGGVFSAIQLSLDDSESQSILFILRSACIIISVLIAVLSMTLPRLTNPNQGLDYDISKKTTKSGSTNGTTVVNGVDYRRKYLKLKKLANKLVEENDLSSLELST